MGGRGHVKFVRCETSAARIPKDKAISKMVVRNIVDSTAYRDLNEASVYASMGQNWAVPKLYLKQYYSVSAAIHLRIVKNRSRAEKRIRECPKFNRTLASPARRLPAPSKRRLLIGTLMD